jgi:hypothetical protein
MNEKMNDVKYYKCMYFNLKVILLKLKLKLKLNDIEIKLYYKIHFYKHIIL